jgi:hypothetical protein
MRSFFAEASFEAADGERLNLVCDFYTIQVVEEITGEDWEAILPQLVAGAARSLKIKVLFGLLRKRHPDITLDEAAAVTFDNDEMALGALMGAVIAKAQNFGEENEEEKSTTAKKKSGGRSRGSGKSG